MKKLLLVLLICLGAQQVQAQDPDPNLFRTWYLYEMQLDDAEPILMVSNYQNPSIDPYISISNTLEYNGVGSCNTFMGTYSIFGGICPTSSDLSNSMETCAHAFFESSFFQLVREYCVSSITQDSSGFTLVVSTLLGGYAIFKDYELSVNENSLNKITLFPNPVTDILFIASEGQPIETISVYSISGKRTLFKNSVTDQIDVSGLKAGLYFAEITTSEGRSVKKFIKK